MREHQNDMVECLQAEGCEICVAAEEVKEHAQITINDTGWSEEEKERMQASGYDSLDIVRAWYS